MTEEDEFGEPGPPVEPVEDVRRRRQPCPECGKTVGNLPSHLAQKHGIRGNGRASSTSKKDRTPRGAAVNVVPIRIQMQAIYELAASMWMVKDPYCATALMRMAPVLGRQWEESCKASPALERVLSGLAAGGAIVPLVAAHVPLAVAIVQHHGPAAQAERRAEEAAWLAQQEAAAANGEAPEGWVPPHQAVAADEAYGPMYAPGSADAAR